MVNLKSGSYYSLDKVGADVWDLLVQGSTMKEVTQGIAQRYDALQAEVESAVHRLVEELMKEDLVAPVITEEAECPAEPGLPVHPATNMERLRFETPVLQKYTDMQDLLLLDPIHDVDETGWPNVRQDSA